MSERKPIPTATPPRPSASPRSISRAFVRRLNARKLNLHSVLVIRHVASWPPRVLGPLHRRGQAPDVLGHQELHRHRRGQLIGEGKVSPTDPIVKFFQDQSCPEQVHPT